MIELVFAKSLTGYFKMSVTRTIRFLTADGFYEDVSRLALLLAMVSIVKTGRRQGTNRLQVVAFGLGLLALRLEVSIRRIRGFARQRYEAAWAKLEGSAPSDVEASVARGEAGVRGLRSQQAKGIVWADEELKTRTEAAVVFLHGWSGSRLELSPLCEELGRALGANCYFARLPGHGLEMMAHGHEGCDGLTLRGLVAEAVEALAIGRTLGRKVLLVGMSTGGALTAWLGTQPWAQDALCGCVLVSANVVTEPSRLVSVLRPWPVIRELTLFAARGLTSRLQPRNEGHRAAATLTYPTRLITAVLDASAVLALEDPAQCRVPVLAFHNPRDPRSSFKAAARFVAHVRHGRLVPVEPPQDEHQHIITGHNCAPSTLPLLLREADIWLRAWRLLN